MNDFMRKITEEECNEFPWLQLSANTQVITDVKAWDDHLHAITEKQKDAQRKLMEDTHKEVVTPGDGWIG